MRRCMDCPLDATHTLRWSSRKQGWTIEKATGGRVLHHYCKWHCQVRATQRNARGVLPPMAQLRKVLGYPHENP